MGTEKSISFRSNLVSNTLDLIAKIGWNCSRTAQLIAEIVSQLAAYTEEGVAMTPSVFICNSVEELVQRAGVGEYIPLSSSLAIDSSGPKILKAAAPLCTNNWRIYVERSDDGLTCRYGVFCGTSDPSSLTIDEVVLGEHADDFPVLRIAQSAVNKVEVRTNARDSIEFRFNNDIDVPEIKIHENIKLLASAISKDSGPQAELFSAYAERVLSSGIRDSHGTLIAVIKATPLKLPERLSDSISIDPPIHLYERFKQHLEEGRTATSVSRLQSASELVAGLISSDGITVFSTAGHVMGYRAFVQSDSGAAPAAGGARTRAFAAMKQLVGNELVAAFFRSQDGRTDYFDAAPRETK